MNLQLADWCCSFSEPVLALHGGGAAALALVQHVVDVVVPLTKITRLFLGGGHQVLVLHAAAGGRTART